MKNQRVQSIRIIKNFLFNIRIDKNIKDANPQVDSFEFSDSWKNMPRRTEGIANKTNGLYRRSELPPVPMVCTQFSIETSV